MTKVRPPASSPHLHSPPETAQARGSPSGSGGDPRHRRPAAQKQKHGASADSVVLMVGGGGVRLGVKKGLEAS